MWQPQKLVLGYQVKPKTLDKVDRVSKSVKQANKPEVQTSNSKSQQNSQQKCWTKKAVLINYYLFRYADRVGKLMDQVQ